MFSHPRGVARWSIIGGLVNASASARCFFLHEHLIGAWLGFLALAMVGQYYIAGSDAEAEEQPPQI